MSFFYQAMVLCAVGFLVSLRALFLARRRGPIGADQAVGSSLPFLLCVTLCSLLVRAKNESVESWSGIRLATSLSLRKGYDLYYPADSGPVSGHIYGPVGAWAYVPATFANEPADMVMLGSMISECMLLLPVAWIIFTAAAGLPLAYRWFLLACFVLVWQQMAVLRIANIVHVEPPAVSLGAVTILLFHRAQAQSNVGRRSLLISFAALMMLLSILSKITMLPLLLAMPLAAWVLGIDWRNSALFTVVGIGLCFAAYSVASPEMRWNTWTIPIAHPWRDPAVDLFHPAKDQDVVSRFMYCVHGLHEYTGRALLLFLVPALLLVWGSAADQRSLRDRLQGQPLASLFLMVGIVLIPAAVAGYAKVGGDVNSLYPSACCFALAGLVCVRDRLPVWRQSVAIYALVAAAWIGALSTTVGWEFLRASYEPKAARFREAYELSILRPGKLYFCWMPLLALYTEGKHYHFAYGVYDRDLAGYPVSPEHLQAHLPPEMEAVIAYSHDDQNMLPYLREYRNAMPLPSGLLIFSK